MKIFKSGDWKLEFGCVVLPGEKFRMSSVEKVTFDEAVVHNDSCYVAVFCDGEEYRLLVPADMKIVGNNVKSAIEKEMSKGKVSSIKREIPDVKASSIEPIPAGEWKMEHGCVVLPDRKLRMNAVDKVSFNETELEDGSCCLSVYFSGEEYRLMIPADSKSIGWDFKATIEKEMEMGKTISKQIDRERNYRNNFKSESGALKKKIMAPGSNNYVALNLRELADLIERIGTIAFVGMLALSVIIGFLFWFFAEGEVAMNFILALVIFLSGFVSAFVVLLVTRLIVLLLRSQAEIVQNTYNTSNAIMYALDKKEMFEDDDK